MALKILAFVLCVSPFVAFAQEFRRSLQTRFDALEERYDHDYVVIKNEMRDLWNAYDYISVNCCISQTVPVTTDLPQTSTGADKICNITAIKRQFGVFRKAFAEEKNFIRNELDKIADVVGDIGNTCKRDMTGFSQQLQQIEDSVRKLQVHHRQIEISQRLSEERFETMSTIMTKLQDKTSTMEEALEQMIRDLNILHPSSCADLVTSGITSSGVYTLYTSRQSYTVFCLFRKGGGYTFIYPETLVAVNIDTLSNDNSHVIIRHRRSNGLQYESRIEQITRYAHRPLTVQYNSHVGYNGPVNSQMTPYVYVGLTPRTLENGHQHQGDTQGYKSNGKDITFVNCDGNPNGYFAFLFNHNDIKPSSWYSPAIARQWVDTAVQVPDTPIPDKFLSFFELHFGGCGTFASTDRIDGVTGAAVGIPFKL